MRLIKKIILFFFCNVFFFFNTGLAQNNSDTNHKPINQLDDRGKRQGLWWIAQPSIRGEQACTTFGNYDHGMKLGLWYKISEEGDLISIENFRFDVFNGEVKYFEQGQLACIGHYRGMNPTSAFDTVMVVDPVTGAETLKYFPSERGYVRHGNWRFYNPATGRLTREEEYQVDELIYRKDFPENYKDSTAAAKEEAQMPHRQQIIFTPPKDKQFHYTDMKE